MTWREDLRRVSFAGKQLIGASFRGVPFFVESADRSGGRRVVVHEFPLRADPFIEDMGRRARKFPVAGYVIGDDYLVQQDALLTALEDVEGPGELVHPYYGVKRAICDTVDVHVSRDDGGMAHFAIVFCEAPVQSLTPTVVNDPASKVAGSAAVAKVAAKAELVQRFDFAGLPAFALASAAAALSRAAAALSSALGPVAATAQELAVLTGQVSILTAEAASLVRQPDALFDAVDGAITGMSDTIQAAPGAVLDGLLEAYAADLGVAPSATTSTRRREIDNQTALTGALRRIMVIQAAKLAPLVPFTTIEDATAARDAVAAQLEEQAAGAGDTAYPGLVTLRSDVMRAVPGARTFARVITVSRPTAIPSLVLAYQLYGSVARELDVVARNRATSPHPGFMSGALKVLSNG